ncbi:homeobox-containing protein 1-like isoform X2 [Arapaima gigas]
MRQWCLPAVAPRAEPLLAGRPSPPPSDSGMACCEVEPRYTIEQIDLLQRLRLSGMSKPQIIQALESLERLDTEPRQQPCCDSQAPPGSTLPPVAPSSSSSSSSSLTSATTQTLNLDASLSPSNSYEASPPPVYPVTGGQRSFGYDGAEEDWDLEEKVEEYMRRDSSLVKEEIKAFLNNRRISQAVVGQVTGISQSYISQWLLQQGLEMSDSKRRSFYRWYLLERNSPGGHRWNESQVPRVRAENPWSRQRELLSHLLPWCSSHSAQPGAAVSLRSLVKEEPDWRVGATPAGGGATAGPMRLRRGSRFTWRKECQAIMESFFVENQYPDEAKREEIANACNLAILKPGCKLSEFERVTALKVYNWFANRRKEMKRRANIGTAVASGRIRKCPIMYYHVFESHLFYLYNFSVWEEVSSEKDAEMDAGSLTIEPMVSLGNTPPLQLANQEQEDSKREVADEE